MIALVSAVLDAVAYVATDVKALAKAFGWAGEIGGYLVRISALVSFVAMWFETGSFLKGVAARLVDAFLSAIAAGMIASFIGMQLGLLLTVPLIALVALEFYVISLALSDLIKEAAPAAGSGAGTRCRFRCRWRLRLGRRGRMGGGMRRRKLEVVPGWAHVIFWMGSEVFALGVGSGV